MILRHRPGMVGRKTILDYLNYLKVSGSGVEVGTHQGQFAETILQVWKKGTLWCVDHYPSLYDEGDPAAFGDREKDHELAKKRLSKYLTFQGIIPLPSIEAARTFTDGSLDFVYIDAKHRYPDVKEDLNCWWSKLKQNGVLSGHDVICPGMEPSQGGWGKEIQPALFEFAEQHGVDIWIVPELDETGWSFFTHKK